MSIVYRRDIPRLVTLLLAVIMVADYYITGVPAIGNLADWAKDGVVLVTAFAQVLGAIIVMRRRFNIARKREARWQFDMYGVALFLVFVVLGVLYSVKHPWYTWLFSVTFKPLDSAGKAILMFFIVSAGFRIFSIRNLESAIITVTMMLTVLAQVPIGELFWREFPSIGLWLDNIPTTGAYRGIMITSAFGAVMLCLRSILGIELGYFRREGA